MRPSSLAFSLLLAFAAGCVASPTSSTDLALDASVVASSTTDSSVLPPVDAATTSAASRCTESGSVLTCAHEKVRFEAGGLERTVFYQVPIGAPPPEGWPVVVVFQPSIYWAEAHWTGFTRIAGQVYATESIAALLDAGYAVITPQAQALVDTVWETNLPPFSGDWGASHDDALMRTLFEQIENGFYGPLDSGNLFATGMSSGGYMTSRMALSYPGRFRALVIQSGAWATCVGPVNTSPPSAVCNPPEVLPAQHPPTLFLHGAWDAIVPIGTMRRYHAALVARGFETRKIEVPYMGHVFLGPTPAEMLAWFEAHRR